MKKTIYLTVFALFFLSTLFAQKKSVGFAPFSYNHQSASQESALTIYNYVVQAFDATQRFSVKDRIYGFQVVSDEQELTKNEKFMDGDVLVKKGKLEDAEWMVSGQIMAAGAVPLKDGGFESNIAFFIRVYDVVTGEVVASEIISPDGRADFADNSTASIGKESGFWSKVLKGAKDEGTGQNEQEALSMGMQKLLPHIKSFVREKFPFEFNEFLIQPDEFGVKKVIVRGSEQMGAELGQIFNVIFLDIVEFGDEKVVSKRLKGELKIVELAGKVFYLMPKNKKNDYVINFMEENKDKIILRESGDKAGIFDQNPFEKNAEKKKRRKEEKERKKAAKNQN